MKYDASMINRYFLVIFLFTALPFSVTADFKAGGDAYKKGDYETAAKGLRRELTAFLL